MSKSNPLGLGVTNTYDEPNGLRDVFGANGFVPNYAQEFTAGDIHRNAGIREERKPLAKKINEQIQSIDASIYSEEEYRKQIDKIIKKQKKNGKSIELSNAGLNKANEISKRNTSSVAKNTVSKQANTAASQTNIVQTAVNTAQTAVNTAKRKILATKLTGAIKNMNQGMGGMGLIMGLPMLAGFIPGADRPGSVGGVASGVLSGAATGASIGMMFPGWGTAIGAAVGALGGLVSSIKASQEAIKEESKQRAKSIANMFPINAVAKAFQGPQGLAEKTIADIAPYMIPQLQRSGENITLRKLIEKRAPSLSGVREQLGRRQRIFTTKQGTKEIIATAETGKFSENLGQVQPIDKDLQKIINDYNKYVSETMPLQQKTIFETLKSLGDTAEILPKITPSEGGGATISTDPSDRRLTTYSNFLNDIAKHGLFEGEGGMNNLAEVLNLLALKSDEAVHSTNSLSDAIILRLNKEKLLLSAQDKFNKDMRVSSNLLAEMNNQYNYELRTRGHLMTETEKAQNAYNQAINTAAAARYDAERKAEFGQTKKLITTLKGSDFEQKFEEELAAQGLSEQGFADLSVEDQKEIAIEVGKQSGYLQKINMFLRNSSQELASLKEDYADVEQKAKNRAKTEQEITNELIRQKTGPGAMGRGMDVAFHNMREQVKTMDYELGQKIPFAFADGMANAMTEALNGTKNIKEALTDAAISFLAMMQKAMMQKAAYSIVGTMGFSGGGNVRKYSRGGGVPAMVSNGEYVMSRDAVAKYGGSFMHGLNAGGKIPRFSNGGAPGSALAANFGGGRGYESGRVYQNRAMSGFFYRQSGNVGLAEDTSALQGILAEEERKRQEAEARRQAKKAKRRQLIGSLIGIAATKGLDFVAEKGLFGKSIQQNALRPNPNFEGPMTPRYLGGPIRKYASGGHISGKSGIDQIPAMLSEGEYVIRASSARQIGKPMLDRINAGKFNEGGAVSELMGSSETASSGGNTNNINISINMERGSGSKRENQSQNNSGQNPVDRSSDEQNNAALAERIKQQVVSVIVEEQRPGGLLSE